MSHSSDAQDDNSESEVDDVNTHTNANDVTDIVRHKAGSQRSEARGTNGVCVCMTVCVVFVFVSVRVCDM